jgi:hypothetical protein
MARDFHNMKRCAPLFSVPAAMPRPARKSHAGNRRASKDCGAAIRQGNSAANK